MTTLAERYSVHSFLGDYFDDDGDDKSRHIPRVRALAILLDDDSDLPPVSVLEQKIRDDQEAADDAVLDGEDMVSNVIMGHLLRKYIWRFSKMFVKGVSRFIYRAGLFLGKMAIRFLVRGLLMPLAGLVVGILGIPVTVALGVTGVLAYIAYKLLGHYDVDTAHIIRQTFGLEPEPTATAYAPKVTQPITSNQTRYAGGVAGADAHDMLNNVHGDLISIGKANVRKAGNVDLSGMNPEFMSLFYAMVGDYVQNGGGSPILVTSGYRSIEKQQVLYNAYLARGKTGYPVAHPGRSRHQSGVAIDVNQPDAYRLEASGYLAKYHFLRPIRSDPVHIENSMFHVNSNGSQRYVIKDPTFSAQWLANMEKTPDKVAALDYPDAAVKFKSEYTNVQTGAALTYQQIYDQAHSTPKVAAAKVENSIVESKAPAQPKSSSGGSQNTVASVPENKESYYLMHNGMVVQGQS